MTEEEYAYWQAEGDQRIGRCPYCGKPGWIVGDTEWCEHYAGTDSLFDSFLGEGSITDFAAYDELVAWLEIAQELPEEQQQAIAMKLSPESRRLVEVARDRWGPRGVWKELVPHEALSVDVEESLCETTYFSYFVQDLVCEQARLEQLVTRAMANIVESGLADVS